MLRRKTKLNRRLLLFLCSAFMGTSNLGLLPNGNFAITNNFSYAQQDVKQFFELGVKAIKSGDFNNALINFKKFVDLAPNEPKGHYNLAVVYKKLGYLDESDKEFNLAESLKIIKNKALNTTVNQKSSINTDIKPKQDLTKPKQEKLTLKPKVEIKNNNKALPKTSPINQQEKHKEVINNFENTNKTANIGKAESGFAALVRSSQPIGFKEGTQKSITKSDQYLSTGYGYYLQGNYQETISNYQQAIKLDSKNYEAYYELGNVYQDLSKFKEAMDAYEKAINLNNKFSDAYKKLAYLKATHGDINSALNLYEKVISIGTNDPTTYYMLGKIYNEKGDTERALRCLNAVIEIDPKRTSAYKEIAAILQKQGKKELAKKYILKEKEVFPVNTGNLLETAQEYLNEGDFNKATGEFKRILLLDPANSKAKTGLSESLYLAGKSFAERDLMSYAYQMFKESIESDINNYKSALELAKILEDKGENTKALTYLEKIPKETELPELHYVLGKIYFNIADYNLALAELQKVNTPDNNRNDAVTLLSKIYMALNQPDKAKNQLEELLKINPDNVQVIIDLANIYSLSAKKDDELQCYNKIINLDPSNYQIYKKRGDFYLSISQYDSAINDYKKYLSLNSKDTEADLSLALCYFNKKEYQNALTIYKNLLSITANDIKINYQIAIANKELGNYNEAIDYCNKVMLLNPDYQDIKNLISSLYTKSAEQYIASNSYDMAQKSIEAALNFGKYDDTTYLLYGKILKKNNLIDKALNQYKIATEINPNNPESFYQTYLIYKEKNQMDLAEVNLQKAMSLKCSKNSISELIDLFISLGELDKLEKYITSNKVSLDPGLLCKIGDFYSKKQHFDKALKYYQESKAMDNKLSNAYIGEASILIKQKRLKEAKSILQELMNINPNNYDGHYNLGIIHKEEKNYQLALREFDQVTSSNPNYPQAEFFKGLIEEEKGNLNDAFNHYENAIRLKKDFQEAGFKLSHVAVQLGKLDRAIDEYNSIIKINPSSTDAYFNLSVIYNKIGKPNEAISSLLAALKINPEDLQVLYNLGSLYIKTANYPKAINVLYNISQKDPDNANNFYLLGTSYYKNNLYIDAQKAFEKAIKLNPRVVSYYYNLGLTYLSLKNQKMAINNFQQAINCVPSTIDDYFCVATIYKDLSKYDKAIDAYNKIVKMDPNNSLAMYKIALIYETQNNLNKMEQELQMLLTKDNKSSIAQEAQKKLNELKKG